MLYSIVFYFLLLVSLVQGHSRGCLLGSEHYSSSGQCCGTGKQGSDREPVSPRKDGQGCCFKSFHYESRVDAIRVHGLSLKAGQQEGMSYCIAAEHYQESGLRFWNNFMAFRALFEIYNMDIGTHISPEDYNKMNKFEPESGDVECQPTDGNGFLNRPAKMNFQPDTDCLNPYIVQITEITVGGIRMHNWLHVVVRADAIRQKRGAQNCPTGKMKYVILEARDELGNPVGEFTDEIPCHGGNRTGNPRACPAGLTCRSVFGTKKNYMPCMFVPNYAIMVKKLYTFIPLYFRHVRQRDSATARLQCSAYKLLPALTLSYFIPAPVHFYGARI